MTKRLCIILIFTVFTFCSFGQSNSKYIFFYKPYTDSLETNLYKDTVIRFDYNIQYANLISANINDDVDWAIKNNDLRIISLSGNSYVFPGLDGGYIKLKDGTKAFVHLDKKFEQHFKKYGFKVIKGTSDFIDGNELPLQSAAFDYSNKYNKRLFAVLNKTKS